MKITVYFRLKMSINHILDLNDTYFNLPPASKQVFYEPDRIHFNQNNIVEKYEKWAIEYMNSLSTMPKDIYNIEVIIGH